MAKQTIGIGSTANDGTGDPLRNAFDKVNDNFNELYFSAGGNSPVSLFDSNLNIDYPGKPNKISFLYSTEADLLAVDASVYHGAIGHAHDTGALYYAHGEWRKLLADTSAGAITNYTDPLSPFVYDGAITNDEAANYVLQANGDDTYTWVAQGGGGGGSSYTNSDVDAHINTSAAQNNEVLSWDGSDYAWVAQGGGGSSTNSFATIAIAGVSLQAASATDTLTISPGANVTLTGDPNSNEITIAASGGGGGSGTDLNSLSAGTIDVASDFIGFIDNDDSSNSKKESIVDLVAAIAGSGLTASAGQLTASSGSSTLADLTEVDMADLDLHDMAATAVSTYYVVGPDSSRYTMDQLPGDNPTVYVTAGQTVAFELNGATSSHPFEIRQPDGTTAYNTGLVHYANDGTKSVGSAAQGQYEGTLYWKVPGNISGTYKYICTVHSGMIGDIVIADPSASSGGGGSLSRVTELKNTGSFTGNQSVDFTTLGKSYALYTVVAEKECRIRIYSDAASRTADLSRPVSDDPPEGAGVIAEFVATSPNTTFKVTPAIYGYIDDGETVMPVTVTNNTGGATDIDVTFTVLKLEDN